MKVVHRFPQPTWIENVAQRSNGDLLITLLSTPELHSISPLTDPATQTLVHSFGDTSNITSLLGITELEHDVFAFIAGNSSELGSYSVWQADFRHHTGGSSALITKVADVPSAGLLNGMTTLDPNTVLIADSWAGNVIKLDMRTGKIEVAIDDASMNPNTTPRFTSGINGIKRLGSTLYFTNSFTGKFHRVQIDRHTGKAIGAIETVASDLLDNDDFAVREDATVYAVRDSYNIVEKVQPNGTHAVFAGSVDSVGMAGPTAATIGRTPNDMNVLYVVTNGGIRSPVGGTDTVGGTVVAISLP
jgi:hypothetical protein